MKRLAFLLALCCAPLPAAAHKVIAGVFASGAIIEGEIGFSDGAMARGAEIIVTGPDGAELGRTVSDADGFFVFRPTRAVSHTFFADLGAGHVAKVTMPAGEVARIMGVIPRKAAPSTADTEPAAPTTAAVAVASLTEEEQQAIADLLRDEIRPLRREIAAYREQNDVQTILGGIGYILGLFGLGFYLAARRKLGAR
ncbi:cobalt ABC transporter permease [Phaeobacter sp. PT47_59]|uniref:cobalt ABC transporter permease n=1 Tax=Phaeobacter sp. PT47_59 TaxID=3029979 RepID=UPI002380B144|nr:cobalt ABC transporter permease [Phaeobacter sp. PT47_59]MDE4173369.1 cobalt ABC transporter permease [Phaeobacter sp. PT47_59]